MDILNLYDLSYPMNIFTSGDSYSFDKSLSQIIHADSVMVGSSLDIAIQFLTDDLLRPVLLGNPHLTSLDLSECHHLTSGILHTLSSRWDHT